MASVDMRIWARLFGEDSGGVRQYLETYLSQWDGDKMAEILQTTFYINDSMKQSVWLAIKIAP